MRKYFLLTAILSFLIISELSSQSLLVQFTMKKHLEFAREKAKDNGLTDPKLVAALTTNQDLEYLGQTITVNFNMENGKSDMWVYVFKENNDTTKISAQLVLETIFGRQNLNVPLEDIQATDYSLANNLDLVNYADSDEILKIIKENKDFADYYVKNKPLDQLSVALFSSLDNEVLLNNEPFWGFIMAKGDNFKLCGVHAVDKTVFCTPDIVNVIEIKEANRMSAYPNPAEDIIEIENFTINGNFNIYDVYGRKIDNVPYNLKQNGITLKIQNLTSGVYYLRTENDYLLFLKN